MNLTLVPVSLISHSLSIYCSQHPQAAQFQLCQPSIPYNVVSKGIKMIVFRLLPQCPGMSMILSNVARTLYPHPFYLNFLTLQKIPHALKLNIELFSPWKL